MPSKDTAIPRTFQTCAGLGTSLLGDAPPTYLAIPWPQAPTSHLQPPFCQDSSIREGELNLEVARISLHTGILSSCLNCRGPLKDAGSPVVLTSQEWNRGEKVGAAVRGAGEAVNELCGEQVWKAAVYSRTQDRGVAPVQSGVPPFHSAPVFSCHSSSVTVHLPHPHRSRAAKEEPCARPPRKLTLIDRYATLSPLFLLLSASFPGWVWFRGPSQTFWKTSAVARSRQEYLFLISICIASSLGEELGEEGGWDVASSCQPKRRPSSPSSPLSGASAAVAARDWGRRAPPELFKDQPSWKI